MPTFESDTARWHSVQKRDRLAHSAFVYAVLTTNIFCRPNCPARLARRANVKFFDAPADALKSGFRPCKRCKPDQDTDFNVSCRTVSDACKYILQVNGDLTAANLAEQVGISSRHLHTLFKDRMGCTPAVYAAQVRKNRRTQSDHAETSSHRPYQAIQKKREDAASQAPDAFNFDLYVSTSSYANTEALLQDMDISTLESSSTINSAPDTLSLDLYGSPSYYENFEALLQDIDNTIVESSPVMDSALHMPPIYNLDVPHDVYKQLIHDLRRTISLSCST